MKYGSLTILLLCFLFFSLFSILPKKTCAQVPRLKELLVDANFILSEEILEVNSEDLMAMEESVANFLNYMSNLYASSSRPPAADTFEALSNTSFIAASKIKIWTTKEVPTKVKLMGRKKFLRKARRRKNGNLSFTKERAYRVSNIMYSNDKLFAAIKVSASDMIFTQNSCRTWFVFYGKGANGWYYILSQGSGCNRC